MLAMVASVRPFLPIWIWGLRLWACFLRVRICLGVRGSMAGFVLLVS